MGAWTCEMRENRGIRLTKHISQGLQKHCNGLHGACMDRAAVGWAARTDGRAAEAERAGGATIPTDARATGEGSKN